MPRIEYIELRQVERVRSQRPIAMSFLQAWFGEASHRDEVRRWLVDEDSSDESAWGPRLRVWIRDQLVPRSLQGTQ
jgi:hypothetical protein